MPCRGVARPRAQHLQALVEQCQQRRRRQHAGAGRCQLDGQGKAIQVLADRDHGAGVLLRQGEVRICATRPVHEESDGRRRGDDLLRHGQR